MIGRTLWSIVIAAELTDRDKNKYLTNCPSSNRGSCHFYSQIIEQKIIQTTVSEGSKAMSSYTEYLRSFVQMNPNSLRE